MKRQSGMMYPLIFFAFLVLARGESSLKESESDNGLQEDKYPLAEETFGSPIYGALPYGGSLFSGKSGYNYPMTPYPAGLAGYLSNPYAYGAYNRFTSLPSSISPFLGYGQNALGYGFSTPLSRYGAFGSSYFTSPYYPSDRLRYPGYPMAGLGYRYGGPAYALPAPIKGSPASRLDGPVARAAAVARYSVPPAAIPAPFTPYPLPVASMPPPAFAPYRPALRTTQAKDGSLRYPDVPLDVQGMPMY